jgi:hypothetical protein
MFKQTELPFEITYNIMSLGMQQQWGHAVVFSIINVLVALYVDDFCIYQ